MEALKRLLRARNDVNKIRENIPNSKSNLLAIESLLKAEKGINDSIFHIKGEELEKSY